MDHSTTQLVMVSVGTDHHPFDRLVSWMDAWAGDHQEVEVIIQYGSADVPTNTKGDALLQHDRLRNLFARADVVVSHGGPSTVMDARMAGRIPIVVARNPAYGEHVDGHQMVFANHLQRHDMAILAATQDQLYEAVESGLADPTRTALPVSDDALPAGVVAFGRHVDGLLRARQ
ncbi:MAG: glycosyl transferase family 28 [Acidimicrobiales bacterium]|nr:glycosyl transferase family 28 [Acidimicrobiales bacterium]